MTENQRNNPITQGQPASPSVFLENLTFSYKGEDLFRSLDFKVEGGLWTCLIGPSGVGKSTFLRLISGSIQEGFAGSIRFENKETRQGLTAWMAQKDLLLPWLSVVDNVCLGARLRGEITGEIRERAVTLLQGVGLGDYIRSLPSELSGGMRQRVALLRTFMENRPVILMDEPFSALDALTRLKLQDLAADLVKGSTVLMVTHDPLEALRLGHRVHVMNGKPATLSQPIVPPGNPPRKPGERAIISLQADLLNLLEAEGNP